jgi:hypothetical protein
MENSSAAKFSSAALEFRWLVYATASTTLQWSCKNAVASWLLFAHCLLLIILEAQLLH